jgi:hypothetical protein
VQELRRLTRDLYKPRAVCPVVSFIWAINSWRAWQAIQTILESLHRIWMMFWANCRIEELL